MAGKIDNLLSLQMEPVKLSSSTMRAATPLPTPCHSDTGAWEGQSGEHHPLNITSKKDVLLSIGDWNAKVGSQEIPGVTGKFGLGVQNEVGKS